MTFSNENGSMEGEGPAAIGLIIPTLVDRRAIKYGNAWFGVEGNTPFDTAIFQKMIRFVQDKRARAIANDGMRLTKDQAKLVMAKYYQSNRSLLPADIASHRDNILHSLQAGIPVAEAFRACLMK